MDYELPGSRGRTSPGMALAVAMIVAAGVTGMAVAGLTWALDRPAAQSAGTPPDLAAAEPAPTATGPVDTPGWAEALGLPAPAPVPSGGEAVPVDGMGSTTMPAVPGTAEATRRAAAGRRPVAGPTAPAVRSTPTATTVAAAPDPTITAPDPTAPTADPDAPDPGVADPGLDGTGAVDTDADDTDADDPGAADPGAWEPTPAETTAPNAGRRNWDAPRRQWRNQPRGPAPWSGPFGNVPRLFPWG